MFYGQIEFCNGQDDNCNGFYDEGYFDLDDDGLKDCADPDLDGDQSFNGEDCVPSDAMVYSGVVELCNGVDDNCMVGIDEGFFD